MFTDFADVASEYDHTIWNLWDPMHIIKSACRRISCRTKRHFAVNRDWFLFRTVCRILLQPVRCRQEAVGPALRKSFIYRYLLQLLTVCQRDNSMLTFESASVAGAAGIVEKLSVSNPSLWGPVLLRQSSSYRASHSRKSNMPSRLLMHNPLEIMAESWSLLQARFWWVAEPRSSCSEMSS